MSLDVSLIDADGVEVFSANITHNLAEMARFAGIYECLWRPEEHGIVHARHLIDKLCAGVSLLATHKALCEERNSPNGWGTWANFLPWCCTYLQACRDNPNARVEVSR